MRAVNTIFVIFLSFVFVMMPSFASAEEYLDEMGCVAYDDTPICYKPSFIFANEDPMFEHWVVEKIEVIEGICTVTFHSVTEADTSLDSLEETLQQQIFHAGHWQAWMDFDIEIWDNGCKDTGLTI